jgi:hypothetical protein
VPVRCADASGDAFIFTQFLDFSTQRWADKIGYGTSVDWPSGPLSLQPLAQASARDWPPALRHPTSA